MCLIFEGNFKCNTTQQTHTINTTLNYTQKLPLLKSSNKRRSRIHFLGCIKHYAVACFCLPSTKLQLNEIFGLKKLDFHVCSSFSD